jgi:hypothetical protein
MSAHASTEPLLSLMPLTARLAAQDPISTVRTIVSRPI